jgi:hypothetical protein
MKFNKDHKSHPATFECESMLKTDVRSIVRELVQSVVEQDKDKKPTTPRPIKGDYKDKDER